MILFMATRKSITLRIESPRNEIIQESDFYFKGVHRQRLPRQESASTRRRNGDNHRLLADGA